MPRMAYEIVSMRGRISSFQKALLRWFDVEKRDLPWRHSRDPYAIYLAEIMLQQTRIEQGTPYYERFLKRFPTLQSLGQATEEDVLKLWEGLGYYTRARNLFRTARLLMEEYDGVFPKTPDELQRLPGIGKYTACAIASIAFNNVVPVVDGNVKRVLARLNAIEEPINLASTESLFWRMAQSLVPHGRPGDFNQAMMELGARICIPKSPTCPKCPVRRHCDAFARNVQLLLPRTVPKSPIPCHHVAVAVIKSRNGKYLIGKRPSNGFLGGLWEFPGGKINPGEAPEEALRRESLEELSIEIRVDSALATVRHAYSHFNVVLHVYRCTILNGRPRAKVHTELRWVRPEEFSHYPFPKGNHKFIELLREGKIRRSDRTDLSDQTERSGSVE